MRTVAVIGASSNRNKFGNKAVRAYREQGYTVYPVNLTEAQVEGEAAYRTILDVPERPDRVTVYIPPQDLVKILPDIAVKGCSELWLNPGAESPEVVAEAKRLGLNVVEACSILDLGVSPHEM
ncbi:MAG: CoA-binding protein [Verrucomicrobiia bacterium]